VIVKKDAIVIKSFSYGESSLIGRVLLNNGEKTSIMIKGAKSLKSNKTALFQSMNFIQMDYYHKENRDIQLFKEGNLINGFVNIKKNFKSISYGLCLIDIIDKALPKHYKDQSMFDIAYKSLFRINNNENYKIIFIYFLLAFSHYNGYSINDLKFNSLQSNQALQLFIVDNEKYSYSKIKESMHNIELNKLIKSLLSIIRFHIPEMKNVKTLKFIN